MSRVPQLDEIKGAAQARILDVLAALGVNERARGGYISMCNPVEKDRHPSFTIWIRGAVGSFKDHRGFAQGDVIDLVAYLKGWSTGNDKRGRKEALRWLADLLGLARMSDEQRRADASRSIERAKREDKERGEELAKRQARAFKLFTEALPLAGTAADLYLFNRGIDLELLPKGPRGGLRTPSLLRFLPDHPHIESGRKLPCMIAGCTNPAIGDILAVHRTWLALDGAGKANVVPVRKCWPDFRGLVIPLWRGDSGLSVCDAAAAGLRETLVLAEGIETALSAAIAAPAFRTWAFISLGNLANVTLPECIDSVALHRENEWSNPQAVKAFEQGKAALEKQGRPVAEIAAPIGKDLNDTLRGAA
jgi:hypothetical protein